MKVKAFLHPAGSKQAPKHSEYEITMLNVESIVVVKNANLINESFLQVINENEPVFAIIYSINSDKIWKFDSHMKGSAKTQNNISATPVLATDLGAMLVQKETKYPNKVRFSVRVGDEEYFAGDTSGVFGQMSLISLNDLIDFVSGEITWESLKGRSYLYGRKLAKEESCQSKNAELAKELNLGRAVSSEREGEVLFLKESLGSANAKLAKIPGWLKKVFLAA